MHYYLFCDFLCRVSVWIFSFLYCLLLIIVLFLEKKDFFSLTLLGMNKIFIWDKFFVPKNYWYIFDNVWFRCLIYGEVHVVRLEERFLFGSIVGQRLFIAWIFFLWWLIVIKILEKNGPVILWRENGVEIFVPHNCQWFWAR